MDKPTFTTGPAVQRAADAIGSQADLAKLMGVSRAFVCYLVQGDKRMPVRHVPLVAERSGVPDYELRPDRFERSS